MTSGRNVHAGLEMSMKNSIWLLNKPLAVILVMLMAVPFANASSAPQQQDPKTPVPQDAASYQGQPPSPGTASAAAQASQPAGQHPDSASAALSQTGRQSTPAESLQSSAGQQQQGAAKPVGTAAAPSEESSGVAATRPAGAVIAPAKQRRTHTVFVRVAIVVGAGVAIGTVLALTHASPSHPQ